MKNMTKRIILSVVTLVLVVVALGTTTFAWFTLSGTATVSDITGTVQAGEGLEVGLSISGDDSQSDFTGYRNNLTASDWATLFGPSGVVNDLTLGAVTTNNGTDFTTMVVHPTITVSGKTVLETTSINANGPKGYIEFVIHFKSDSAAAIHLMDLDFDETGQAPFTPGVAFESENGPVSNTDTVTVNAANAARIGIFHSTITQVVVQKDVPTGTHDISSNTANNTAQFKGQYSYLMAKNYLIATGTGTDTYLEDGTDLPTTGMLPAITDLTVNGQKVADLTSGNSFKDQATVRVWLEGWDADMYDAMYQSLLKFNFVFDRVI